MHSAIILTAIVGLVAFLSSASGLPAEHASSADRDALAKRQAPPLGLTASPPSRERTEVDTPITRTQTPSLPPSRDRTEVDTPVTRPQLPSPPRERTDVDTPLPRRPQPPSSPRLPERPSFPPLPRPERPIERRPGTFIPPPPRPTRNRYPFGTGLDNPYVRYYGAPGYFHTKYNLPLVLYRNQVGYWYRNRFVSINIDQAYLHLWEEQPFPDLDSLGRPIYVIDNVYIYRRGGRYLFVTSRTAAWLPVGWEIEDGLPQYVINLA